MNWMKKMATISVSFAVTSSLLSSAAQAVNWVSVGNLPNGGGIWIDSDSIGNYGVSDWKYATFVADNSRYSVLIACRSYEYSFDGNHWDPITPGTGMVSIADYVCSF